MTSSAEIHIQGTDTDPAVRARKRAEAENQQLLASLRSKIARLTDPEPGHDGPPAPASRALVAFCSDELRRHLRATDLALYAPAAAAAETRLLVSSLRATVASLDSCVDGLADDAGEAVTAALARSVEAVLTVHFTAEHEVLLPALADLPGMDLPAAVADRTTLLQGGRLDDPDTIDVRQIPHGRRHPRIFGRYARLAPGEFFTLVNNHDPKPLRREFEAAHPGAYTWDYLESGPEQWRVRIGRTADRA